MLVCTVPGTLPWRQTDNGFEFTSALRGQKCEEPTRFELALRELRIEYRRIRVGTPKHNGKVERQHGLDMLRFYKRLAFASLDDAVLKVAAYNAWSNTRIKTCLDFRSPNQIISVFPASFFHLSLTPGHRRRFLFFFSVLLALVLLCYNLHGNSLPLGMVGVVLTILSQEVAVPLFS